MLKKNAQTLGDALAEFFEKNESLKIKLGEYKVVEGWREVLGEGVSHYTKKVYLRRDVLHVQLTSAVLRAELLMNKEALVEKLNEYAGIAVVRDIVIR